MAQPVESEDRQHAGSRRLVLALRARMAAWWQNRRFAGESAYYDAFISYSNVADDSVASALRYGLHRFAKRRYQLRAVRVYADRANLSAGPGIWPQIQSAIAASRYFILLASPESADSEWVNREVGYWLDNRSVRSLLIVVTGGDVVWDKASGDFSRGATTALPARLFGWFDDEPVWIDLRWARRPEHVSYSHAPFKDVVATLAAPLHGRSKDALAGEDVRLHTRAVRIRRGVMAALAILTAIAIAASVLAYQQRGVAFDNQALAEQRARVAISRQLAAEASELLSTDSNLAKQLSIVAHRTAPTAEATTALLNNLGAPGAIAIPVTLRPTDGVFSPDGRILAIAIAHGAQAGTVDLWEVASHTVAATLSGHVDDVEVVAFSPDGTVLASGSKDHTVRLWDMTHPRQTHLLGVLDEGTDSVESLAFNQDGHVLATGSGETIRLWDVATPARPTVIAALPGGPGPVRKVQFAPDGRRLASSALGAVRLWEVSRPEKAELLATMPSRNKDYWGVTFAWDGVTLASSDGPAVIRLWDVTTPQNPVELNQLANVVDGATSPITALTLGRNGHTLVSEAAGQVLLWDIADPRGPEPEPINLGRGSGMWSAAFSPDGRTLATVGWMVHLWDTANPVRPRSLATFDVARSYSTPSLSRLAGTSSPKAASVSCGCGT